MDSKGNWVDPNIGYTGYQRTHKTREKNIKHQTNHFGLWSSQNGGWIQLNDWIDGWCFNSIISAYPNHRVYDHPKFSLISLYPLCFAKDKQYESTIYLQILTHDLVGGWPTPLKNDGVKVSWDDDIPNWMESQKIPWFQTTNQYSIVPPMMVSYHPFQVNPFITN